MNLGGGELMESPNSYWLNSNNSKTLHGEMNFGFLVSTSNFKSERIQPKIFGGYTPFLGKSVKAVTPLPLWRNLLTARTKHTRSKAEFLSVKLVVRTLLFWGEERPDFWKKSVSSSAALEKTRALLQSTGSISRSARPSPIFGVKSYFRWFKTVHMGFFFSNQII